MSNGPVNVRSVKLKLQKKKKNVVVDGTSTYISHSKSSSYMEDASNILVTEA